MNYTLADSVEIRPGSQCLRCGLVLTGAAGVVAEANVGVLAPSPGDFTVCIACGHVMAFDEKLAVRELTEEEKRSMDEDDRIMLVQAARKRLERANKRLAKGEP